MVLAERLHSATITGYVIRSSVATFSQRNQNNGGCTHATADAALKVADLMISLGLKDAGYQYLNIDDCWTSKARNSTGHLVADPSKWPQGIKPIADKIHNMGLKFGLYGDAGSMTCAGYPGSQGHEAQDAKTLASWGVDYWKHDACYLPCATGGVPQTCWDSRSNTKAYYATMRDALAGAGRPILFAHDHEAAFREQRVVVVRENARERAPAFR